MRYRVRVVLCAVAAIALVNSCGEDDPAILGGTQPTPPPLVRTTMYVDGTTICDRNGEPVVLRGANAGIAFPGDPDGSMLAGLAQTGANTARLTFRWIWNKSDPAKVDTGLQAAADQELIAMPAVWDATGNWSKLGFCVEFWTRPEMVEVLRKHEAYTLLNIANEAGKNSVTNEQYREEYTKAIHKIRAAGLHMPLVIDAAHWGRGENYILDNAEYLLDQDPERNLIFSWHPWDTNQPQSRYKDAIDTAQAKGICMIIGEFSSVGVFYNNPIDYAYIMEYCEQMNVGWLWWWWYGSDDHSLTVDGTYGNWSGVGEEVCVSSSYSIANTSHRTAYFTLGTGSDVTPVAPAAPTNLQATVPAGAQVDLTWRDNAGDERNYDIEVRESGGTWRLAKVVAADSQAATIGADLAYYPLESADPFGLKYNTSYDVRVGAWRANGVVSYSKEITVTTKGPLTATGSGTGLTGEYYYESHHSQDFADYAGPVLTRVDPTVDFNWGSGAPDPAVTSTDHFQVRWTGQVETPRSGRYTFYTNSNDFARLWVNGEQLINNWEANARGWAQGTIDLVGGQKVDIQVEYREWEGTARMHLYWASPVIEPEIIPADRLYP